jgi:hypothetical protein
LPEGQCKILQGISNNWSMTKQIYKIGNLHIINKFKIKYTHNILQKFQSSL